MEDQNSWKGHSFTLMIFGGIVVLCAIFFVLGMLVGRMQGLKLATITAEAASTKSASKEVADSRDERPEFRLPEPSGRNKLAAAEPVTKPEPPPARSAPKAEAAPAPSS